MDSKIKLSSKGEGVIKFIKKYGYFIAVGIVAIAIALTVILTSLSGGQTASIQDEQQTEDPTVPVNTDSITLALPVLNAVVLKDYTGDEYVWNADLEQYETHKALQLASESDSSVYCVLDGTVLSVGSDFLEGGKIVVEHQNGLVSVYSSLADGITLKQGDSVKKGDKIATMSDSASSETSFGSHLHFELLKDGKKVNPNEYINFENK